MNIWNKKKTKNNELYVPLAAPCVHNEMKKWGKKTENVLVRTWITAKQHQLVFLKFQCCQVDIDPPKIKPSNFKLSIIQTVGW